MSIYFFNLEDYHLKTIQRLDVVSFTEIFTFSLWTNRAIGVGVKYKIINESIK